MNKKFQKNIIFNNLYVYENALPNHKDILNYIKKTESYTDKKYAINPWQDWNANWAGRSSQFNKNQIADNVLDSNFYEEEVVIKNLYDVFNDVIKDYVFENKDEKIWQYDFPTWDLSTQDVWKIPGGTVLKYNEPNLKSSYDYSSIAMNYHTDFNHDDVDSAGLKLTITLTMYLNDNYSGGEVSFYDEKTNTIHNYKPKAGDITVFPSARPFYHGVFPFFEEDRYLIRMFLAYNFQGTKEWITQKEILGEEKIREIDHERRKKGWEDGSSLIHVSYDGKKHPKFKTVFPKFEIKVGE
jgi:hypothetical protein